MQGDSILIVDDNPFNLELARVILAGEGYDVQTAKSAEAALASVKTKLPRLVLTDLLMPGTDGYELTRLVASTHNVPVIALTACAMEGDRRRALAAGCSAVLLKPIEPRALVEAVVAILTAAPEARSAARE